MKWKDGNEMIFLNGEIEEEDGFWEIYQKGELFDIFNFTCEEMLKWHTMEPENDK